MGLFELVLVGFGLAMDAFAVAIGKGLNTRRIVPRQVLITGLWFGGFQALMPFVGYLLGCAFSSSVESIDHWIAFTLLAIIGLNMIREAIWGDEEHADADTLLIFGDAAPGAVLAAVEAMEGTVLASRTEPAEGRWKRRAVLENGEVRYLD